MLAFDCPVIARSLALTFQGGFVGLRCSIYVKRRDTVKTNGSDSWMLTDSIFPEDVNGRQLFTLSNGVDSREALPYDQLKLVFEQSSDFFGRIVVYDLSIEGDMVENSEIL